MRKIALLMFVFTLFAGTNVYAQKLKNGTYKGNARGYSSEVKVKVSVSGGKIKDIDVDTNKEPIGSNALSQMVPEIIRAQSTIVDVVGGATITSEAFIFAVNNALEKRNPDIVRAWEQEGAKKRLATAQRVAQAKAEAEEKRIAEQKRLAEEEKRLAAEKLKQELQNPVTPAASEFKYDVASDGGVKITKYLGNSVSIKIPEKIEGLTVTEIEKGAFDNSPIKKIVLPTIKKVALSGHTGLREVIIEDGWRYVPSFSDCINLSKVTIPDSVTNIGVSTFENCTNLSEIVIPDSVTSIGSNAFQNCKSLNEIVIPDSITEIATRAFEGSGLTSVIIPNSVTRIGLGAFANCDKLTSIKLPAKLKIICSYVFAGNGLTSIVIPDSVVGIDEYAFYGCKSLTSVTLPASLTHLGSSVFEECSSLSEINIPASLEKIVFSYRKLRFSCDEDEYLSVDRILTTHFDIGFGVKTEYEYRSKDDVSGIRYYYHIRNKNDNYDISYFYTYHKINSSDELRMNGSVYRGVSCFSGCSNLPLATKSKLRELGYSGEF